MLGRFYKNKAYGYWISVAVAVLAVIVSIVYAAGFAGTAEFNLGVVLANVVSVVAVAALIAFGLDAFVPMVQFVCALISLALYVYAVYYYVSVVVVGIDAQSFSGAFIVCSAILLINTAASTVTLFAKRVKV